MTSRGKPGAGYSWFGGGMGSRIRNPGLGGYDGSALKVSANLSNGNDFHPRNIGNTIPAGGMNPDIAAAHYATEGLRQQDINNNNSAMKFGNQAPMDSGLISADMGRTDVIDLGAMVYVRSMFSRYQDDMLRNFITNVMKPIRINHNTKMVMWQQIHTKTVISRPLGEFSRGVGTTVSYKNFEARTFSIGFTQAISMTANQGTANAPPLEEIIADGLARSYTDQLIITAIAALLSSHTMPIWMKNSKTREARSEARVQAFIASFNMFGKSTKDPLRELQPIIENMIMSVETYGINVAVVDASIHQIVKARIGYDRFDETGRIQSDFQRDPFAGLTNPNSSSSSTGGEAFNITQLYAISGRADADSNQAGKSLLLQKATIHLSVIPKSEADWYPTKGRFLSFMKQTIVECTQADMVPGLELYFDPSTRLLRVPRRDAFNRCGYFDNEEKDIKENPFLVNKTSVDDFGDKIMNRVRDDGRSVDRHARDELIKSHFSSRGNSQRALGDYTNIISVSDFREDYLSNVHIVKFVEGYLRRMPNKAKIFEARDIIERHLHACMSHKSSVEIRFGSMTWMHQTFHNILKLSTFNPAKYEHLSHAIHTLGQFFKQFNKTLDNPINELFDIYSNDDEAKLVESAIYGLCFLPDKAIVEHLTSFVEKDDGSDDPRKKAEIDCVCENLEKIVKAMTETGIKMAWGDLSTKTGGGPSKDKTETEKRTETPPKDEKKATSGKKVFRAFVDPSSAFSPSAGMGDDKKAETPKTEPTKTETSSKKIPFESDGTFKWESRYFPLSDSEGSSSAWETFSSALKDGSSLSIANFVNAVALSEDTLNLLDDPRLYGFYMILPPDRQEEFKRELKANFMPVEKFDEKLAKLTTGATFFISSDEEAVWTASASATPVFHTWMKNIVKALEKYVADIGKFHMTDAQVLKVLGEISMFSKSVEATPSQYPNTPGEFCEYLLEIIKDPSGALESYLETEIRSIDLRKTKKTYPGENQLTNPSMFPKSDSSRRTGVGADSVGRKKTKELGVARYLQLSQLKTAKKTEGTHQAEIMWRNPELLSESDHVEASELTGADLTLTASLKSRLSRYEGGLYYTEIVRAMLYNMTYSFIKRTDPHQMDEKRKQRLFERIPAIISRLENRLKDLCKMSNDKFVLGLAVVYMLAPFTYELLSGCATAQLHTPVRLVRVTSIVASGTPLILMGDQGRSARIMMSIPETDETTDSTNYTAHIQTRALLGTIITNESPILIMPMVVIDEIESHDTNEPHKVNQFQLMPINASNGHPNNKGYLVFMWPFAETEMYDGPYHSLQNELAAYYKDSQKESMRYRNPFAPWFVEFKNVKDDTIKMTANTTTMYPSSSIRGQPGPPLMFTWMFADNYEQSYLTPEGETKDRKFYENQLWYDFGSHAYNKITNKVLGGVTGNYPGGYSR